MKLIHEHIHVDGISHEMEEMVLDATVIDNLMNQKDLKEAERVMKILVSRFARHRNNSTFIALSQRLETLRTKAEQGLISSIEFIKHLCEIACETVQAEKQTDTVHERKTAKAALTELFLEMKTDQTPAVVERIVTDIDNIVKYIRYDGWQNTTTGEKLVMKELRKILWVKYPIKDEELFNRAYAYIREYY